MVWMCRNKKCSYIEEIEKNGICPQCGTKAGEYTSWLGEVSLLKRRKARYQESLKPIPIEEKKAEEITKREEELKIKEQDIFEREHEALIREKELSRLQNEFLRNRDDLSRPEHKFSSREKEVAEYLKKLGFYWIYESPVFVYDEKERPRVWTPDFYIPKLGVYIEVCGSEEFDYEYRENIYRKNGFNVVFIHVFKKEEKWKKFLVKRIMEIEEQRYNEVIKTVKSLI